MSGRRRVVRVDGQRAKSQLLSASGQAFEILKATIEGVQDLGGGDLDVRRIVKDEVLRERVAKAYMADTVFEMAADLGRSFEAALKASGFHTNDPEIMAGRFHHCDASRRVFELGLMFIRASSAAEAQQIMAKRALKPSDSAQLLAWGASFPNMVARGMYLPVVALGRLWSPGLPSMPCGLSVTADGELRRYNIAVGHAPMNFLTQYCDYSAGYED